MKKPQITAGQRYFRNGHIVTIERTYRESPAPKRRVVIAKPKNAGKSMLMRADHFLAEYTLVPERS